ncbi:MAG TPA: adenylosuccinate lyase [Chitinophagaceae bacterium]|nr:adenylosuccinate lyase [Chitinophagaceae bacterium]
MSDTQALLAVSPIDGRYKNQLQTLSNYFSEYALIKYRIHVEIEYFIALSELKLFSLSSSNIKSLRSIVLQFSSNDAQKIKDIEKITNHDVKAVEYFLKEKLIDLKLNAQQEWIHFGLTSQDINNTSIPLLWKYALTQVYLPSILNIINQLKAFAKAWNKIPMLAKTHGQPASPTILGKEIMVFIERLENQLNLLKPIPFAAKFGGATGNFNAHYIAYPKTDWKKFANQFVNKQLGLKRMQFTTQIEHYDSLASHFDALKRINTILLDFSRDIWTYISMDYFKQKVNKNEVGSSAMPHKVNPIDFENAEGNLGIANALFEHLSAKLPISRLQRDLTDSTVLRNIGVPFAHTILAFNSLVKGMNKLIINEVKINADLESNWAVVAEAIQTILRREKYPKPYEALKELTRGAEKMDKQTIHTFIDSLKVSAKIKLELKKITPQNYVGRN